MSTGGVYSISSTIGQHDAGEPMSGGNYSLAGGFWSLFGVVQTPGAPTFRIARTDAGGAIISWPAPSPGWQLEQTTALVQPEQTIWAQVTSPAVVVVDGENTISFNAASGVRYLRLRWSRE